MNLSSTPILLRSMFRDRYFALTNIAGLAIAFMCCTALAVYLKNELTYDQHHLNHERLYRLVAPLPFAGNERPRAAVPQALGPLFARDYPQVQNFARFRNLQLSYPVRLGDSTRVWDTLMYADSSALDMFTHRILAGDPANALDEPNSIAVSKSFAQALRTQR